MEMPRRGPETYLVAAHRALAQWPRHLAAHVTATALGTLALWPLLAALLQHAVALSGSAALADLDIAAFLLSPTGSVALVVVTTVLIAILVVETAAMMAIDMAERRRAPAGALAALNFLARRSPAVLCFALGLALRVFALLAPALALAALIAWALLTERDINYYLADRPPAFWTAAAAIGAVATVAALVIAWRLILWSLALPLVLFAGLDPAAAFRRSAHVVRTRSPGVLPALATWALASLALSAAVTAGLYGIGAVVVPRFVAAPVLQALALGLGALVWVVVQALAAAYVNASFALSLNALAVRAEPEIMAEARVPAPARDGGRLPAGWALAGLAGLLIAAGSAAGALQLYRNVVGEHAVRIIAHRGGASAAPENTLAAIERGIADGADWLEIDVQEDADGTVIVMHDRDFMRQAGMPLGVHEATAADIAGLDVGAWFGPGFAGERVATLDAVLQKAKGRAGVLIELKYYGHAVALEQRVADAVGRAGMEDAVAAMSLDAAGVARMHALRPDWPVGLLTARAVGDLTALPVDFLAVNTGMATGGLLRRAHAAGRELYVWTVNDPVAMRSLALRGVDGLITDRPAEARAALAAVDDFDPLERLALLVGDRLGLTN
jgi:glycerophosphoryl diester phosphodiesterase